MLVKLESVYNTFFFLEDICIQRGKGPQEIDLSTRPDSFIKTIGISVSTGLLSADKPVVEIVGCIKDKLVKDNTLQFLGYPVEAEIVETVTAEVEIVEEVETTVAEEAPAEKVEDESIDDESEPEVDPLKEILEGTNKIVVAKIKNAGLTTEQKAEIAELEKQGRNRAAVLSAIDEA